MPIKGGTSGADPAVVGMIHRATIGLVLLQQRCLYSPEDRILDRKMSRVEAVIVVEQLTKTYDLGEVKVEALRGIDVRIHRGEFVAIMGASGSGKSTLMNILGCLDRPTSGRYLLEGIDVAQMSANWSLDICATSIPSRR